MKRGAIDRRTPASVRWAVSAGCPREFPCTASSARCLMAGHHLSAAFLVQPHSHVSAQVALPNVSGSITGTLPRALWLAFGQPQSSFTISSSQVRPVTACGNGGEGGSRGRNKGRQCVGASIPRRRRTRISTRTLPRQLPRCEGRYRRSIVPRVAADSRSPTATDDRGDARYRATQSA